LVHQQVAPFEFYLPTESGASVPIAGTIDLRISVVFEAETSGALQTRAGFELRGSAYMGHVMNGGGFESFEEHDLDIEPVASEVSVDAGGRFSTTLRVRTKMDIGGAAGPIFSLGPYVEFDAQAGC
jgi:hypothetical protein